MNNKRKQLIVKIVAHLVLLLGAITMLVPFIWMLSSSVKSLGEVFVFPPKLFGEKIVWENYTKISSRFNYFAYFLNSVKVSAWVVVFQVFTSATAGYVFAKLNFKGRDRIFTLYLATMMIPFHVTVITNFLQMSIYGLVNTLWSLMLPASVSAFGTFLMRQFFVTVPNELIEAAKIDGASKWQQITRITLPFLVPAAVTLLILNVGKIFFSDFGLFYQVPQSSGALFPVTQTIDTYVYRALMSAGGIGRSAAASVFQSIVGFVLVMTTNLSVRKVSAENAIF